MTAKCVFLTEKDNKMLLCLRLPCRDPLIFIFQTRRTTNYKRSTCYLLGRVQNRSSMASDIGHRGVLMNSDVMHSSSTYIYNEFTQRMRGGKKVEGLFES